MSRISIIGASGMIGQEIAREAVKRGHDVIGTNRSGDITDPIEGVTYRALEINDTAAIMELAQESDVLVFSVPGGRETGDYAPVIKAHAALIVAQPEARIFIIGGAGGLQMPDGTLLVDAGVIPEEYGAEPRSFVEILNNYRESEEQLDWVMLAPSPEIYPGEQTDSYVLADDEPAGEKVSTGTFAAAALDEMEKPTYLRTRFTVADA